MEPLPLIMASERVADGIWRWNAFSPHHQVDLTSHLVWDGVNCIVFDPLPLSDSLWASWPLPIMPDFLITTNANHQRAVASWLNRFPKAAYRAGDGWSQTELARDDSQGLVTVGIPVGWSVHRLTGGAPGETALHCPKMDLLVFGDAVVHLPSRGLELLPDKYCMNPVELRRSLLTLPPAERALFAHGTPILGKSTHLIWDLCS